MDIRRRSVKDWPSKQSQRPIGLLILAGVCCVSVLLTFVALRIPKSEEPEAAPLPTSVPFDPSQPFSVADLTAEQLIQLRQGGTLRLSDGPRNISVGDPLDKILLAYPTTYDGEQPDEEQILYCAAYLPNQNGVMTALPPRGLLSADDGRNIVVTLLAPTQPYPEGTLDNYRSYEHVYCRYTIDPDTMTVSAILLGITR